MRSARALQILVIIVLRCISICDADSSTSELPALPNNIQQSSPESNSYALKTFGRDLGNDFANLFSSSNVKPLIFLGTTTAASFGLDHETREVLENGNHRSLFSNLGHRIGGAYTFAGGLAAVSLIGLSTGNQKLKSVSYDLVRGYVLEAAIILPLKHATGRERPDDSNNLSFPSGHTTTGFLWATVLNHHYGHKVGIPAYAVAAYIAASRLKRDVHYFSDVVAGAGIGYLIGRTITHDQTLEKKTTLDPFSKSSCTWRTDPGTNFHYLISPTSPYPGAMELH